ncbi:MAG: AarF/UbiB family protein [Candidatus Woesearchaeota archaeon]
MQKEDVVRIKQVITVLAKHGLGGILSTYGFAWYVPIFKRSAKLPEDMPKRLRMSMEELGGAYIKLGQLLSVRPDLVPQEYCDEFAKLQDEVPPEPISAVEKTIEVEFGKPWRAIFTHIDPRPLGSASVAQVHKARLRNGKAVAIKVQRQDVHQKFSTDIAIIRYIGQKLQKHLHNNINIAQIVDEFERYTKKELDFTIEASHISEICSCVKTRNVVIPKVFWPYTTERVLAMEYLEGTKLSEMKITDKPHAAKAIVDAFVDQLFTCGTFHADLHPGNVLLMGNNKVGLLDFGIVGHLDTRTRKLGLELYLAVLERDPRHIAQILLKYGTPSSKTDINTFVENVGELVYSWWESNPEKRKISQLLHKLFILCAKHHIRMPADTILLGKGMMTVEATAHLLDPHFNLVTYSQPRITQLLKKQHAPQKEIKHFAERARLFAEAISELPARTLDTIDRLREYGVTVSLKDTQFRHIGKDLNLSSNRLSYALIAAACILAGSLMINIGPKIADYSIISLASLTVASVFVIILFISITREHTTPYDPHD